MTFVCGKPLPATTGTKWQQSALRYVPVIRNEKIVSYKTAYFGKIHLGVARTGFSEFSVF